MYYKRFSGANKHVFEHHEGIEGLLLVITSNENQAADIANITVSSEINSPNSQRVDLWRRIPIEKVGLLTSQDEFQNNKYNIDIRPDAVVTKGFLQYRQLNFTSGGNLPMSPDERLIITLENTENWNIEVFFTEKTFTGGSILKIDKETIKSGEMVTLQTRKETYLMMDTQDISADTEFRYNDNSSHVKALAELRFQALSQDEIGLRSYVNGKTEVTDFTSFDSNMIIDLTGSKDNGNWIKSIRFDQIDEDMDVFKCSVVVRDPSSDSGLKYFQK